MVRAHMKQKTPKDTPCFVCPESWRMDYIVCLIGVNALSNTMWNYCFCVQQKKAPFVKAFVQFNVYKFYFFLKNNLIGTPEKSKFSLSLFSK